MLDAVAEELPALGAADPLEGYADDAPISSERYTSNRQFSTSPGLPVRLGCKSRGANIGYPDLHGAESLCPQTAAMRAHRVARGSDLDR